MQMLYGSDRALKEGWFPEARHRGSWKVSISYDPRNVSIVYLWDESTGAFEPCHLLDHQERYMNKTLNEVQNLIAHERKMRHAATYPELQVEVNFYSEVEDIVKTAAMPRCIACKTISMKRTKRSNSWGEVISNGKHVRARWSIATRFTRKCSDNNSHELMGR